MAGRLLQIHVLAGLHSHNGGLGVPMVRHRNHSSVEFVGLQHFADVGLPLRKLAGEGLDLLAAALESVGVTVAYICHFTVRHLGKALCESATT